MKYEIEKWNKNPARPTIQVPPSWKREQWIASMVKEHGWTQGAELGVWKGRTFLHVLAACPNVTMVGVDLWEPQAGNEGPEDYLDWPHHENEKMVRQGAARFGECAIIHKMMTSDAAELVEDNSLDFIFIDADHSTEAVHNDILTWSPKIKDDGWIIGHDINWPTVKVVADELLPGYVIGPDNAWARKKVV